MLQSLGMFTHLSKDIGHIWPYLKRLALSQVVDVGAPRSGTQSLKLALQMLGLLARSWSSA